ncbi:hypothetical protein ACFS6H_15045 [Terrimonas rubra]|uniref:Uncharacterized protein n=1 Tax=Terrimonas rubra TaxID=1035890 RepID=A0ABW6A985_9BACT
MSYLKATFIVLALCCVGITSNAQDNKTFIPVNEPDANMPKLFSSLPSQIPVSINNFNAATTGRKAKDAPVQLVAGKKMPVTFNGTVVSTTSKYDGAIETTIIRLTNYEGATLTLSTLTDKEGNKTYTGRIISMKHGDVYELQQVNNEYQFVKKDFNLFVHE